MNSEYHVRYPVGSGSHRSKCLGVLPEGAPNGSALLDIVDGRKDCRAVSENLL